MLWYVLVHLTDRRCFVISSVSNCVLVHFGALKGVFPDSLEGEREGVGRVTSAWRELLEVGNATLESDPGSATTASQMTLGSPGLDSTLESKID